MITEREFYQALKETLKGMKGKVKSVSGPGRSGAIAAVYTSHLLKIPFISHGSPVPANIRPHLVIDTALMTGRTLRKAARKMNADFMIAVIKEDSRQIFWYESDANVL